MTNSHINIFISLISLLFNGCDSPVKTNVLQSSFDVKQSKANGVFVAEYTLSKNELNFKCQSFYIQQVWIEHYWSYKNINRDIEIRNSKCGYIKFKNDENVSNINFIRDNIRSGGFSGGKLLFNISEIKDTLSFIFYIDKDTIPIDMYRIH